MPISNYLQQASSSLARAAEEKLREAEEKRRLMTRHEQETRGRINDLKQYMRQKEVRVGNSNVNDAVRAALLKEIRDDSQQINHLQNELTKIRTELDNEIKQMERAAQDLNQQANNLVNQAAGA